MFVWFVQSLAAPLHPTQGLHRAVIGDSDHPQETSQNVSEIDIIMVLLFATGTPLVTVSYPWSRPIDLLRSRELHQIFAPPWLTLHPFLEKSSVLDRREMSGLDRQQEMIGLLLYAARGKRENDGRGDERTWNWSRVLKKMARAIVKNQAEISSLNKFGFLGIPGAQGDVPIPTNFTMSHRTDTARTCRSEQHWDTTCYHTMVNQALMVKQESYDWWCGFSRVHNWQSFWTPWAHLAQMLYPDGTQARGLPDWNHALSLVLWHSFEDASSSLQEALYYIHHLEWFCDTATWEIPFPYRVVFWWWATYLYSSSSSWTTFGSPLAYRSVEHDECL